MTIKKPTLALKHNTRHNYFPYPTQAGDSRSFWLHLTALTSDNKVTYDDLAYNLHLWVWYDPTSRNYSVEFRIHDLYSATERELGELLKGLRRINKKSANVPHSEHIGDVIKAKLRAAGVKKCWAILDDGTEIVVDLDDVYFIYQLVDTLTRPD